MIICKDGQFYINGTELGAALHVFVLDKPKLADTYRVAVPGHGIGPISAPDVKLASGRGYTLSASPDGRIVVAACKDRPLPSGPSLGTIAWRSPNYVVLKDGRWFHNNAAPAKHDVGNRCLVLVENNKVIAIYCAHCPVPMLSTCAGQFWLDEKQLGDMIIGKFSKANVRLGHKLCRYTNVCVPENVTEHCSEGNWYMARCYGRSLQFEPACPLGWPRGATKTTVLSQWSTYLMAADGWVPHLPGRGEFKRGETVWVRHNGAYDYEISREHPAPGVPILKPLVRESHILKHNKGYFEAADVNLGPIIELKILSIQERLPSLFDQQQRPTYGLTVETAEGKRYKWNLSASAFDKINEIRANQTYIFKLTKHTSLNYPAWYTPTIVHKMFAPTVTAFGNIGWCGSGFGTELEVTLLRYQRNDAIVEVNGEYLRVDCSGYERLTPGKAVLVVRNGKIVLEPIEDRVLQQSEDSVSLILKSKQGVLSYGNHNTVEESAVEVENVGMYWTIIRLVDGTRLEVLNSDCVVTPKVGRNIMYASGPDKIGFVHRPIQEDRIHRIRKPKIREYHGTIKDGQIVLLS